jgi:predicted amidohydrolase
MSSVRIAAAQYPLDEMRGMTDFEAKLSRWVGEAAAEGAQLLVFPEYAGLELASIAGPEVAGDVQASFDALTRLLPEVDALHAELARRHGVHILAGSTAIRRDGLTPNVARLFTPDGQVGVQDKRMMTRGEREDWRVTRGGPLRVFETRLGVIGIAICYDVEFPLLVRSQVMAGAEIILAPSCTETAYGYARVRVGAMARALENQCVSVQAPLVGRADWSAAIDRNTGRAGIFGPPDRGFPESGIIAEGELDRGQWVYGTADLEAVAMARRDGMVLNHLHWAEQDSPDVEPAERVSLI